MGYKTFVCMNIALIGDGGMVESIARKLGKASYNIFIGTKNMYPMLSNTLFTEYDNIQLATIEDAAFIADVIILAVPLDDIKEAAYLLDDVREKVIIDMSGLYFTRFGNYFNSSQSISNITMSPFVVKCYSTDGFKILTDIFEQKNDRTLYYAGDNRKAKEVLKIVSTDLGFNNFCDHGNSEDIPALDKIAWNGEFLAVLQS